MRLDYMRSWLIKSSENDTQTWHQILKIMKSLALWRFYWSAWPRASRYIAMQKFCLWKGSDSFESLILALVNWCNKPLLAVGALHSNRYHNHHDLHLSAESYQTVVIQTLFTRNSESNGVCERFTAFAALYLVSRPPTSLARNRSAWTWSYIIEILYQHLFFSACLQREAIIRCSDFKRVFLTRFSLSKTIPK